MLDNDLTEGLLPQIDDLLAPDEGGQDEQSVSDIDLDLKNCNTFESFKNELKNPNCCLKDIYQQWTILYSSLAVNFYSQYKEFSENEKSISMFKIMAPKGKPAKGDKNKAKDFIVCKYCLEKCISKDLKKKKPKETKHSLSEINKIRCECPIHQKKQESDELPEDEGLSLFRNKTDNLKESDQILEDYEKCDPSERRKWVRNKFDELFKKNNNEEKILDTYNGIFFKALVQFFEDCGASYFSSTFKYGIEIYNDFAIYKIQKLNEEGENEEELKIFEEKKQKSILTYYLSMLILNNCSIFSIKRNIFYEIIPHDLSITTYAYKRKIILNGTKRREFFKKAGVKPNEIMEYYFNNEKYFNSNKQKRSPYNPTNFLIENCFFENEHFKRGAESQRFYFLDLENDDNSEYIYTYLNINNLLTSFNMYLIHGRTTKILYMFKEDPLTKDLFIKELKKSLSYDLQEDEIKFPRSKLGFFLIDFINFESRFLDVSKEKLLRLLPLYNKKKHSSPDFDGVKGIEAIFDVIIKKIKKIVWEAKGCSTYQDLSMIKKTFDLFNVEFDSQKIKKYDFTDLIKDIINHMIIERMAIMIGNSRKKSNCILDERYDESTENYVLEDKDNKIKDDEKVKELFDYILKILVLFCINDEGKDYIYNSRFMQELFSIIYEDIDYKSEKDINFFFEIAAIFKLNFNKKIIANAFYQRSKETNNILISSLFINDPTRDSESIYNFSKYLNALGRVKGYYMLFNKENFQLTESIFKNNHNKNISFAQGIKYIVLKSIPDNFDYIYNNAEERSKESEYRYYVLNLAIYLKHLSNANFLIKQDEPMPLLHDSNYDIIAALKSQTIPFFMKSLILDFLLQFTMTFKVDSKLNNVEIYPYSNRTNKEENYKKHLDDIILLCNIYFVSLDLLPDVSLEDCINAYIERDGLYDFCLSIIKAFNCFSNYTMNIISRYENTTDKNFCTYYNLIIVKFLKCVGKITLIFFNRSPTKDEENNRKSLKKELKNIIEKEQDKSVEDWYSTIFEPFYENIFKKFIPLLDDHTLPESTNVYNRFINFNGGTLFSPGSDDAYSYLFHYKPPEITEEEIKQYKIDSAVLDNYKGFCEYLKKEKIKCGIDIVLDSFENRIGNYTIREYFFVKYFIKILPNFFDDFFNDAIILNSFTKLIIYDKKLINFEGIADKFEILEKYNIQNYDEGKVKAQIIGTLIRKINYVVNYEISISNCFCNTKNEIQLSEYANALIIFTQVLGENFNSSFHEAMFELQFDLENVIKGLVGEVGQETDKTLPVKIFYEPKGEYLTEEEIKKEKETEFNSENSIEIRNRMVKQKRSTTQVVLNAQDEGQGELIVCGIDIKKGCVPYLLLLILYQKILDLLYSTKKKSIIQDNLIMIFHSLTNCLEEFSHVKDDKHKNILNAFLTDMFVNSDNPISGKIRSLLIHYETLKCYEKSSKLDFIINDLMTLLNVYLTNDDKNLSNLNNDESFKECYWEWLTVEYFNQTLKALGVHQDIQNKELFEYYNYKELDKIPAFHLTLKYYEILYMLTKDFNLQEFHFLFEKEIDDKTLEKYIAKCKEQYGIDILIAEDEKNIRKTMYTFLNKIFIDLEIYYEDENRTDRTTTILQSEITYLSEESKKNYLKNVDRSSADTKLLSIYDNLDSLLFEMIYNSFKKPNRWEIKNYALFEKINYLFILIYNILMVYLYYKSPSTPEPIYNQFEPEKYYMQNNYILPILTVFHLGLLIYIFVTWYKHKFIIKYFYDLSQFCKENLTEKDKLSIERKADLFKELVEDCTKDITTAWKFFPGLSLQQKIAVGIIDTLLFNYQLMPFLVTLLCLLLYYFSSQLYLIFPILLFAKFVPTLSAIFSGLAGKFKYLLGVYIYTFITLYVFSWAGFILLPRMFNKEVVYKVDDPTRAGAEEPMCSSSLQCILYFMNFGLTDGNAGMSALSYKDDVSYYYTQLFFDLFFTLLVNMIFANVFTGLITDAFGENREKVWQEEIDKKEKCFICQITKSECINSHIDFNEHREDHSVWKYIYFLCGIVLKSQTEFNYEENYVWNKFKLTNIDWFPSKKDDDDVKESVDKNTEKLDKIIDILTMK